MIELTIDGKTFTAKEKATILEVARENDIHIPTLCYHEDLSPGGRCDLCRVEVISPAGERRLVLACAHKVKNGLEVFTGTEEVAAARKKALAVLLARAPRAKIIQKMAGEYGLENDLPEMKGDGCIRCGICIRACKEIVGRKALSFKKRGVERDRAGTPIQVSLERCLGCGTCAYLCPTGYIDMEEFDDIRIIWGKLFKAKEQLFSGRYYAPYDFTRYVTSIEDIDPRRLNNPAASYFHKLEKRDGTQD